MKKYLFIVFLITISNSLIADTPFSVRRDNVKVFTSPNFENEIPSTEYFYGDTISITLYSDLWAEVILPDGKKGYIKKENLLPATNGFGTLSPEEKIATPLYQITSATAVLRKPDDGSGRVPLQFKKHQILYDAVAVNDDWMSIPIGGGETGYMKTMYLNEISHEEKVEMFGQKPEQHTEIQNTTGRLSGYVNGWQTGPKFIFIIIAVCTILLLLTLYRRNRGPLKGKMLGMYANTLLILSLMEIWYFYSAGMNRVYWFLSFDHILRTLLYVVIMIVFTWVQASAGLNLMDDTIKPAVRDKRKYLWIATGIAAGLFLSYIYRSMEGIGTAAYRFGPDTPICQILGQLPAGIFFARNLRKRLQEKKILFCIYYMSIIGTVVSLVMGSILIFIVFAVFLALAVARPIPANGQSQEEVAINPLCFDCKHYREDNQTCSLNNDVTNSSCNNYRDW